MQQSIASQVGASQQQYRGLQRLAWATLVVSFLAFVLIAYSAPFALDWAIGRIRQDVAVPVRVISGQVYVLTAGSPSWVVRAEATTLNPGDSISTHETAQAFLDLPDGSKVHLYPDSEVRLRSSNVVRYRPENVQIVLDQVRGYSRIAVAPVVEPQKRSFHVDAPHLTAQLQEGSFAVEVIGESRSSIAVRRGDAVVSDGERQQALTVGERATTEDGGLPAAPLPAAQDLVLMGDFTALAPDWEEIWHEEDRSEDDPRGTVTPKPDGLYMERRGDGHGQTLLVQQVNRPVWDFEELVLRVRVKAIYQSLSGGGTAGTEYPIMVRVLFQDISGGETPWYHGFYYARPTDDRYSTRGGSLAPQGEWHDYEVDLMQLTPRPTYIRAIEVVATGWSYEGAVQHVSLVGE